MDKYRPRKTYWGKFKNKEISPRDINEEKIFSINDKKYIISLSKKLLNNIFKNE